MDANGKNDLTKAKRTSDRETVVTRSFHAPARIVFKAWTTPDLLKRWWVPKSIGMSFVSCEMDARTGGSYRFVFAHPAAEQPVAFFGKYLEVVPPNRLVWTNEEGGGAVTTVTFEEKGGVTLVTMHDLYPSKDALDETIANETMAEFGEQFVQLDELLLSL